MIHQIFYMIIEEAQARPHNDISLALVDVAADVFTLILRLSAQLAKISDMEIPEREKQLFIKHLLEHPN